MASLDIPGHVINIYPNYADEEGVLLIDGHPEITVVIYCDDARPGHESVLNGLGRTLDTLTYQPTDAD